MLTITAAQMVSLGHPRERDFHQRAVSYLSGDHPMLAAHVGDRWTQFLNGARELAHQGGLRSELAVMTVCELVAVFGNRFHREHAWASYILFDCDADAVERCRAGKAGKPAKWTVDCVQKIMRKSDPSVVAQLSKTTVTTPDSIHCDDPIFNGSTWTTKRFEAGGSANPATKEIMVLSGTSCEAAAATFHHAIWHQNQPPGMGWPQPAEDDASLHTEQWTLAHGLPGQQGDDFRMTDSATGKLVPDPAAIRKFVQADDPSPPAPVAGVPQPVPVDSDVVGNRTQVRDPVTGVRSWRPSVKGDTFAGPGVKDNLQTVDPTQWKCP